MRAALLFVLTLMLLPSTLAAQEGPKNNRKAWPDPRQEPTQKPRNLPPLEGRVYVGEPAPDFELDAANGKTVRLSHLRGDWVLIAFVDRKEQLAALRTIEKDMLQLGARIVGVAHEKSQSLANYSARQNLSFLMLSDLTGEISATYGLFDHERSETRPGYLMIDRDGIVRMAVLGQTLPAEDVAHFSRFAMTGR